MSRRRTLIAAFAALMAASPLAAIVPSVTVQAAEPEGPQVTVDPSDDLDPEGETVTVEGTGFDSSDGKGIYVMFCARTEGEVGTPEGRPDLSDCSGIGDGAWIGHGPPTDPFWGPDGSFEVEATARAVFGGVDCLDPDTECGFITRADAHGDPDFYGNDTFTPVTFAEPPAEGPQVTVDPSDDLDPEGETVTVEGTGFDSSDGKGIYVMFCARTEGEVGTPEGRPDLSDCSGIGDGAWIGHGPPTDPFWGPDGSFEVEATARAVFGGVDCLDPDTECGFITRADAHGDPDFYGNDTFTPVTFVDDGTGPGDPDPGGPDPGDPDPGTPDPGQQQGDRRASVTPTTGLDASGDHVTVKGSGYPGSVGVYVRLCEAPAGRVGTMPGRPANCDGQGIWVTTAQTGPGTAPISGGAFDVRLPVAGAFTGETAKIDCAEPGACGIFIRRDHFGPADTAYDAWFPIAFADDTEAPDVDEPLPPSLNDVVLEVSPTTDVDDGASLAVKGSKYAPGRGVYVQFCAAPEGQLGTAAGRPNRCYPGQDGTHTVWVSPVDDDGTFRTNIVAEKTFTTDAGEKIDCSEPESCGVVTRRDHDGGANDHSQDAFVPITFGDGTAAPRGAGRITADRTAGLAAAGDTITVTGEGFRPNTAYAMTVCADDGFTCDYGNVTEMTTDADGGFREPLAVQGEFSGVECGATGCEVNTWAVSMSTPEDEATLPIGFVGGPLPRTGSDPMPLTLTGLGLLALGGAAVGAGRRRRFGGLG